MNLVDKKDQEFRPRVRKIIQIAMSESSDGDGDASVSVLALCDDGTLWFRADPWKETAWRRIDTETIGTLGDEQ